MGKQRYSADEVINAIKDADGILSAAARLLGCSRRTVHNYVNRYATVKDAYEEANDTVLDLAESKLIDAVEKGQLPAIMFVLKTKGKHRGYVERQEISGPEGDTIRVTLMGND